MKAVPCKPALAVLLLAVAGLPATAAASELGELLRATLAHPAITADQRELDAAQASAQAALSRYFGAGSAGIDSENYDSPRFFGQFDPNAFADPPFTRVERRYGVRYAVPVDIFGAIAATRAQARADAQAAALSLRQETLLKLHDTVSAYAQLGALAAQQQALQAEQQRVAQMLERVRGEHTAGLAAAADLKLAESELAHVRAARVRLDGSRAQWQAALTEASGSPAAVTAALPTPVWPGAVAPTSLPAQLAAARAQAAQARARAQQRSLLPALSAGAEYQRYDGGGYNEDTWTLGAHLSVPLDASAWLQQTGAERAAQAAQAREQAADRGARAQLAALRAAYDAARADSAALEAEVQARREVLEVQSALTQAGEQTVEDSLRHERDLAEAEERLAQARARVLESWSAAQVLNGIAAADYIAQLDSP